VIDHVYSIFLLVQLSGNIYEKDKRFFWDENIQLAENHFNKTCSYLHALLRYMLCL